METKEQLEHMLKASQQLEGLILKQAETQREASERLAERLINYKDTP